MNPEEEIEVVDDEEACLARHKKERKELQAEIQKLKNTISKGDKKKKKEVTTQIALLEHQLSERHEEELKNIKLTVEQNKKISENLEDLKISDQSEHVEEGDSATRISKSQKRKAKKAQKDAEASERIRCAEAENVFSDRRIEEGKFQKLLASRHLKICQIPSNGDCLYASVAHQLSQHGHETKVADLRTETANYMRKNIDELLPFLVKEETGDLYTEEEYLDYCNKVEFTPEWGGQTELKALSEILKVCLEVIQADGPSIFVGTEYEHSRKLVVTYHRHAYGLGEHYNSVESCSVK